MQSCEPYQACVEGIVNYLNQFCDHIHETTPDEETALLHCAVDGGACESLADCYDLSSCAEEDCTAVQSSSAHEDRS